MVPTSPAVARPVLTKTQSFFVRNLAWRVGMYSTTYAYACTEHVSA